MFASLVLIVFFFLLWRHYGWKGLWGKFYEKALEGVLVATIAFAIVLLWKVFSEPWYEVSLATIQADNALSEARIANLRKLGDRAIIEGQRLEIGTLKSKLAIPAVSIPPLRCRVQALSAEMGGFRSEWEPTLCHVSGCTGRYEVQIQENVQHEQRVLEGKYFRRAYMLRLKNLFQDLKAAGLSDKTGELAALAMDINDFTQKDDTENAWGIGQDLEALANILPPAECGGSTQP